MKKVRKGFVIAAAVLSAAVISVPVLLFAPVRVPACLLPAEARAFIQSRFPTAECVYAERDYDDGRMEYEVRLSDGVELEFWSSGEWKKVDCGYSLLPQGILPPAVEADVRSRFLNAAIYSAERAAGGYEVKAGNGLELIYSADGAFIRLD